MNFNAFGGLCLICGALSLGWVAPEIASILSSEASFNTMTRLFSALGCGNIAVWYLLRETE